jgi:hypothetical protein
LGDSHLSGLPVRQLCTPLFCLLLVQLFWPPEGRTWLLGDNVLKMMVNYKILMQIKAEKLTMIGESSN